MKTLKTMMSMGVLALAVVSRARAAEQDKGSHGTLPVSLAKQVPPSISTEPGAPSGPEGSRPDATANNPERDQAPPEHPDRPGNDAAEEVPKFAEEVKQARIDFLKQQQELKNKLRRATESERDQIRAQLKENRQIFLAQQQDARQDFRQHLAELKEKLREHKEVLEEAQNDARDKAKRRKDGDP